MSQVQIYTLLRATARDDERSRAEIIIFSDGCACYHEPGSTEVDAFADVAALIAAKIGDAPALLSRVDYQA